MQMRGIERLEMMGNLTASIVSHFGDTFLTVRSEAELSAGSLSTTGQWPAALGAGGSAVQLQLQGGGAYNKYALKSSAEGRELLSLHRGRVQTIP